MDGAEPTPSTSKLVRDPSPEPAGGAGPAGVGPERLTPSCMAGEVLCKPSDGEGVLGVAVRSPVDVEAASAVDAAAPWPDVEAGGLDSGGFEGGVVTCTSLTELAVEDARAGSPARPCSAPPGTAGTPSGSVVGETPAPGAPGAPEAPGAPGAASPGECLACPGVGTLVPETSGGCIPEAGSPGDDMLAVASPGAGKDGCPGAAPGGRPHGTQGGMPGTVTVGQLPCSSAFCMSQNLGHDGNSLLELKMRLL